MDLARKKHDSRKRRHTLDEDQLFKADNYGGHFPTVFCKDENWTTRRDSNGVIEKSHNITCINQDSTGRIIKEITEERV